MRQDSQERVLPTVRGSDRDVLEPNRIDLIREERVSSNLSSGSQAHMLNDITIVDQIARIGGVRQGRKLSFE